MSVKAVVGGGIYFIAYTLAGILGLVIHVWTIVIAYTTSGLIVACITLIFPVIAQIYWFFKIGLNLGFGTNYCVAIIAYVVLMGISFLGVAILSGSD